MLLLISIGHIYESDYMVWFFPSNHEIFGSISGPGKNKKYISRKVYTRQTTAWDKELFLC